jgi:hypothetical protein
VTYGVPGDPALLLRSDEHRQLGGALKEDAKREIPFSTFIYLVNKRAIKAVDFNIKESFLKVIMMPAWQNVSPDIPNLFAVYYPPLDIRWADQIMPVLHKNNVYIQVRYGVACEKCVTPLQVVGHNSNISLITTRCPSGIISNSPHSRDFASFVFY